MAGFRRISGGVTARFARPEAAIIRDLVEQVVELVQPPPAAADADELAAIVGMSDGALDNRELPDDPRFAYVQVYQWLAYIQGSLVAALS